MPQTLDACCRYASLQPERYTPAERYPLLGRRTVEWTRGAAQWSLEAFDGDLDTITPGSFVATHPLAFLRSERSLRSLGDDAGQIYKFALDRGPFERHARGATIDSVNELLLKRTTQLTTILTHFCDVARRSTTPRGWWLLARAALLWRDAGILLRLWLERRGRTLVSGEEFERGVRRYAPRSDTVMHVGRLPSIGATLYDCSFLFGHATPQDELDALMKHRGAEATRRGTTVWRDPRTVFRANSRHVRTPDADHLAAAIVRLSVRAVPVHTARTDLLPLLRRACTDDLRVIDWLRATLALTLLDLFPPTDTASFEPQTLSWSDRVAVYATHFPVSAELPATQDERMPLAMSVEQCAAHDAPGGSETWMIVHNRLTHDREATLAMEYGARAAKRRRSGGGTGSGTSGGTATQATPHRPPSSSSPSSASNSQEKTELTPSVIRDVLANRCNEVAVQVHPKFSGKLDADKTARVELVRDAFKVPLRRERGATHAHAALCKERADIGARRYAEYSRWYSWLTLMTVGRKGDLPTWIRFAVNQRIVATALSTHFVYVLRTQETALRSELARRAAVHWRRDLTTPAQNTAAVRRRWVRWEAYAMACARRARTQLAVATADERRLDRVAFVQRRAPSWPRSPVLLAVTTRPPNFTTVLHNVIRRVLVAHPITTATPPNGVRRVSNATEIQMNLLMDVREPETGRRFYPLGNELLLATDELPANTVPAEGQWAFLRELASRTIDGEECQLFPARLFFTAPVIAMYLAARADFQRTSKAAPLQRFVETLADAGDTYHLQMLFVFNRANMAHCAVRHSALSWPAVAAQMAALRALHLGVPPPHFHAAPLPRISLDAMYRRWYASNAPQRNYGFQPFPRVAEPPLPTHHLCTQVCLRCRTLAAVGMPSTAAERAAMPAKLAAAPESEVGAVRTLLVGHTPLEDFEHALAAARRQSPNDPSQWLREVHTYTGRTSTLPARSLLDALDLRAQIPSMEQSPTGLIVLLGRRFGERANRVAFREQKLRQVYRRRTEHNEFYGDAEQFEVRHPPVADPLDGWEDRVVAASEGLSPALLGDEDTLFMRLWRRHSHALTGERHHIGARLLMGAAAASDEPSVLDCMPWVCAARKQLLHPLGRGASGSSASKRRRAADEQTTSGERILEGASEFMAATDEDFGDREISMVRDARRLQRARGRTALVRAARRLATNTLGRAALRELEPPAPMRPPAKRSRSAAAVAVAAERKRRRSAAERAVERAMAAPEIPESMVELAERRMRDADRMERDATAKASTVRTRTMIAWFAEELRSGRLPRDTVETCVGTALALESTPVSELRGADVWTAVTEVMQPTLRHAGTGADPATSTLGIDMEALHTESGKALNDHLARLARQVIEAATKADCKRFPLVAANMLSTALRFDDGRALVLCTFCLNRMFIGPEAWVYGQFACAVCRTGVVPPRAGLSRKLPSAAAATARSVVQCERVARRVARHVAQSTVQARTRLVLKPGTPAQALRAYDQTRYCESDNTDDFTGQPIRETERALMTQYVEEVPGEWALMASLRERSRHTARRAAVERLQSVSAAAVHRPATLDPHPWSTPTDAPPRCAACEALAGTRAMYAYMIDDEGCPPASILDPWSNAHRDVGTMKRMCLCPSDRWSTRVARRVPTPLRMSVIRTAVSYAQRCQAKMRAEARKKRRDGASVAETTAAADEMSLLDDFDGGGGGGGGGGGDDEDTIPKQTTLLRPMLERHMHLTIRADVAVSLAQEEEEVREKREAARARRHKRQMGVDRDNGGGGGDAADDDDDGNASSDNSVDDEKLYATAEHLAAYDVDPGVNTTGSAVYVLEIFRYQQMQQQ